jgi:branched-chain amino acid transport system ATP-binding protein
VSLNGTYVPALGIKGLRAGYARGGDIVCGIDITQAPETILAVIGPNGSGKSTFVKTLAGLVPARAGSISIAGTDVTDRTPAQRAVAGIAYVPQEANVFRGMTVRENLKLATDFLRGRAGVEPVYEEKVLDTFPEIVRRKGALAGNLSGGQRQMLAFACALLANPEVLLLDEPSAGLSPALVLEVMGLVERVRATGVTVLLVEQNVGAALAIADEGVVLVGGRISMRAPARELSGSDLGDLFLGRGVR